MHRIILKPLLSRKKLLKPSSNALPPSNLERLQAIKHDLFSVPHIFCDSITEEPMNHPLMIDIADHHAIDESTLNIYLKGDKHLNPHNRVCAILIPQTFNAKTQENLKIVLEKIVTLNNASVLEKEDLVNEIAEIPGSLHDNQQKLLDQAVNNICENIGYSIEETEALQSEIDRIEIHLNRYKDEEPRRVENERILKALFETYISSLQRIYALKKQLKQSRYQEISKSLHLIQKLIPELETFLIHTEAIIQPWEKKAALGKQEQLLARMKSLEIFLSRLKKIDILKKELHNLENPGKNFDGRELSKKGYSEEEILCIRNDIIAEQKALVITRLINKLEKFIQETGVTCRTEEALMREQKAFLNRLMLSVAPQENIVAINARLTLSLNEQTSGLLPFVVAGTNNVGRVSMANGGLFAYRPYKRNFSRNVLPLATEEREKEKGYSL